MMNYLWGGMLLTGIVYGVLTGNVKDITDAVLASSREAIMLCFTMFGIVAFWSGLMEVAVDAGIMKGMTKLLKPVMGFLFPKIPKEHPALTSISANFVANILGLGWAATPAGVFRKVFSCRLCMKITSFTRAKLMFHSFGLPLAEKYCHKRTCQSCQNCRCNDPGRIYAPILTTICNNINRY